MRKWVRRIAIWSLVVVSLLVIAWTAVLMTGKQRLDEELAYWRARGLDIPISAGFNIKSDETGDPRVLRVIDLYANVPESTLDLINDPGKVEPAALAGAVASCEEILVLIHELAAEEQAVWREEVLDSEAWLDDLVARLNHPRSIERLLDAEILVRARAGNLDGACESMAAGLSLGRQIGEHPSMIAAHIQASIVERMLIRFQMVYQGGGASAQEVVDALWRIDLPGRFIPVIEREGVMFTRLGAGHVLSPWNLYDTAYSLAQCRRMVHSIEVMHMPLDELETSLILEPDPWWAKRYKMMEPGVRGLISRIIHAQARAEIAKAAILLRRYKLKHGVYPELLTDLKTVGGEPYMMTYIEYEQDGDGYLLTSHMGAMGKRLEWREKK